MNEQETWYEIEISRADNNDWYRYGSDHYDTKNSARLLITLLNKETHAAPNSPDWKYRVVEVTMTRKVLP